MMEESSSWTLTLGAAGLPGACGGPLPPRLPMRLASTGGSLEPSPRPRPRAAACCGVVSMGSMYPSSGMLESSSSGMTRAGMGSYGSGSGS